MNHLDNYSAAVGVDLSEIDPELRPASQMRVKLDDEAIQTYAESLDEMPPVTLMYDSATKCHWLVDGCHTIHAAQAKKRRHVQARIKPGDYLKAFAEAAVANGKNAVRETNADKEHRVQVALQIPEWKDWSNRKIADICAVGHDTIFRLRGQNQLSESDTSNAPAKRQGKDGKFYPATKPRKPRKPKPPTTTVPLKAEPTPDPIEIPESSVTEPEPETTTVADPPPAPVAAQPSSNGSCVHDAPEADEIGLIDWVSRWEIQEKYIMESYFAWPNEKRRIFAFKLLGLAQKIRALYHADEIKDRSHESLI